MSAFIVINVIEISENGKMLEVMIDKTLIPKCHYVLLIIMSWDCIEARSTYQIK